MTAPIHIKVLSDSTCDKCKSTIKSHDHAILTSDRLLYCHKCSGIRERLTVRQTINLCTNSSLKQHMTAKYSSLLDVYVDSLIESEFNALIISVWKDKRGY